jgi:hypothetical protein
MNKLNLLEITFNKLGSDSAFMAYYMTAYMKKKDRGELAALLSCSEEEFFRLGLCKIPSPQEADFEERLSRISAYANVSSAGLFILLKEAGLAVEKPELILNLPYITPFFQAIEKKILTFAFQFTNDLKEKIGTSRILNTTVRIGQIGLSTMLIVIFIFNFTTLGKSQDVAAFYQREHCSYLDSIEKVTVRDNTSVRIKYSLFTTLRPVLPMENNM